LHQLRAKFDADLALLLGLAFGAPVVRVLLKGVRREARDDVVQPLACNAQVDGARELRCVVRAKALGTEQRGICGIFSCFHKLFSSMDDVKNDCANASGHRARRAVAD